MTIIVSVVAWNSVGDCYELTYNVGFVLINLNKVEADEEAFVSHADVY